MRKLASLQRISEIEPIPGADNIEVATVKGWKVVVKKGEYKKGDLCIYCEIDSVLPEKPEFEFLKSRGYRIRTLKLRGQISQGLCLHPSILGRNSYVEGEDVTEELGITKYEPPIPAHLGGEIKGSFPHFIPKTDAERVQNIPPEFFVENFGKMMVATEKLDGTSFTAYYFNGEVGFCSRNWELKNNEANSNNTYYKIFQKVLPGLYQVVKMLGNCAIQGEIVGEGIQGNQYKLKGQHLYLFDIYLIDERRYVSYWTLQEFCEAARINIVPFIDILKIDSNTHLDFLLNIAEGSSMINPTANREGLVFRIDENDKRVTFKAVSNAFLLQESLRK